MGAVEEARGAADIRVNEVSRMRDGAVDMSLGSEVKDARDPSIFEKALEEFAVIDRPFNKMETRVLIWPGEVPQVPCISESIEHDKALDITSLEKLADEGRPDESCSTGDEN